MLARRLGRMSPCFGTCASGRQPATLDPTHGHRGFKWVLKVLLFFDSASSVTCAIITFPLNIASDISASARD